jgi:hypothetical protein
LSQGSGTRFRRKTEPGGYERIIVNGSTGPSIIPGMGVSQPLTVSGIVAVLVAVTGQIWHLIDAK